MELPEFSIKSTENFQRRVIVGIPMTGLLRAEWHLAYIAQVIPTNWSLAVGAHVVPQFSPLGFMVADARNLVAQSAYEQGYEWLMFIDHDVILHKLTFLKWNYRMREKTVPLWGGLYFTKSAPSEPLIYRGRGNSFYHKWKLGDEVWCDGMGLGCHVIHMSLIRLLYEESEEYEIQPGVRARKIFKSPVGHVYDPELGVTMGYRGTEDLEFYSRMIDEKILKRAGWPKIQRKKYPYLCDTEIFCRHINDSGQTFPAHGEEQNYT